MDKDNIIEPGKIYSDQDIIAHAIRSATNVLRKTIHHKAMTPIPIKPQVVYTTTTEIKEMSEVKFMLFAHEEAGHYQWTATLEKSERILFTPRDLEARDKEVLREFIDKYGERIFEAGCNRTWDDHFGSVTAASPNGSTFLSSLKAELGLSDSTTEK